MGRIKQITTIEEVYDFLLMNDLSQGKIKQLLQTTLGIWVSGEYKGLVLVNMLKEFLNKYPERDETRPLFLDVDIDKVKLIDFGYIANSK